MLKKMGRWAAARLQGSKGKAKYDDWMARNPWATTALGVGDLALGAYAAPKAIAGLGGLLTGKTAAVASGGMGSPAIPAIPVGRARAAASAFQNAPTLYSGAGRAQAMQGVRGLGSAAVRGAEGLWSAAKANPMVAAMTLEGLLSGQQNAQQMRLEQRRFELEQERRNNLAQLLMPMYGRYSRGE